MKEPGQLAYETHDNHHEWEDQLPWRRLHPQDQAKWAAVEAAVRADERERAAKVADAERAKWGELGMSGGNRSLAISVAGSIAATIRNRSVQPTATLTRETSPRSRS